MTKKTAQVTFSVAKTDNGDLQITFNIPFGEIIQAKKEALVDLAKNIEIPGFRKGKAPLDQVEKRVSKETLIEKTLGKILPQSLAKAINENKLKPAIYPRFELLKSEDNENWEVRATTCEIPEFDLGDFRKIISDSAKTKAIWTPGSGKTEDNKSDKTPTREEKENQVISLLLETIKINIPKFLLDEEVNSRLSSLLERTEKLGLTLEGYLSSLGKTPETLRQEYELQAKNTIALDLILEKIAAQEKVSISEKQIDEVIKVSSADPKLSEKLNTPEQRRLIASILRKRSTLESLSALL